MACSVKGNASDLAKNLKHQLTWNVNDSIGMISGPFVSHGNLFSLRKSDQDARCCKKQKVNVGEKLKSSPGYSSKRNYAQQGDDKVETDAARNQSLAFS